MPVLGQAAPSDTNNAVLYTVTKPVKLVKLFIANTTAGTIAARVFLDDDGATATAATALLYDKSVGANDTEALDFDEVVLSMPGGTMTVRSATGSALTFSLLGEELQ